MFDKLTIKNFQRHRKLEVIFDPAATVLVGSSDAGKSAIIRALRWLCLNRAPKNHIRFGAELAKVILEVDGRRIIRSQGKQNTYTLDGEILRAFSRDVPASIKDLLNVDAENFQRQHDPLFWISLPAPQVTKELNEIVDLSIIDRSLSKSHAAVRDSKAEIKVTRQRIKESKQSIKELEWIEDAAAAYRRVTVQLEAYRAIEWQHSRAVLLHRDVSNIVAAKGSAAARVADAENIVSIAEELCKVNELIDKTSMAIDSATQLEEEICQTKARIQKLEAKLAKVKRCPICNRPR